MADQLGFVMEQMNCTGCKACQMACKDKNDLEVGQLWRRVTEISGGGYFLGGDAIKPNVYAFWTSIGCNHCEDPLCVKNCPTGAMHKRAEDGIVLVDETKCIGCRYCAWSCPYGAPQYNPQKGKMGKCDFCQDYLEEGKDPACVAACPLRNIHYGNIEELKKQYQGTNQTNGMPDPCITKPSLIIVPHKDAVK